jgi:hypothetical protein
VTESFALPPFKEWSNTMQRRRIEHIATFEERLAEEAQRLRLRAQDAGPGAERERLIRRARQTETASHLNKWLSSPGLQSPR